MIRWTPGRKVELLRDIRAGRVTLADAERLYALSAEEVAEWDRTVDKFGTGALRVKTVQELRRPLI